MFSSLNISYYKNLICQSLSSNMISYVQRSSRNLSDQFLYQHRYCDQADFSITVFDGGNVGENGLFCKPFLLNNFDTKVYLPNV